MKKIWLMLGIMFIVGGSAAGYFYYTKGQAPLSKPTKTEPPAKVKDVKPSQDQGQAEAPKQEAKNEPVKILFVGDTMLGRSVGANILNGIDPFEYLEPLFKDNNLVVANLETTVSDKGSALIGKAFTLRAPIEATNYLNKAGIKVVSLANNHTKDYGKDALSDMLERLKAAGIEYFGAGNNPDEAFAGKIVAVNEVKIGLIGVNQIENGWTVSKTGPTSAWMDMRRIKTEIEKLKPQCDIVVVMPHWGSEYHTVQNAEQIKLGHQMIEAGADLVIGMHPHVIQGSETYLDKQIYYSLGNFVFDQMGGMPNATTGELVEVTILNKKISETKEYKVELGKDGRPTLKN